MLSTFNNTGSRFTFPKLKGNLEGLDHYKLTFNLRNENLEKIMCAKIKWQPTFQFVALEGKYPLQLNRCIHRNKHPLQLCLGKLWCFPVSNPTKLTIKLQTL